VLALFGSKLFSVALIYFSNHPLDSFIDFFIKEKFRLAKLCALIKPANSNSSTQCITCKFVKILSLSLKSYATEPVLQMWTIFDDNVYIIIMIENMIHNSALISSETCLIWCLLSSSSFPLYSSTSRHVLTFLLPDCWPCLFPLLFFHCQNL